LPDACRVLPYSGDAVPLPEKLLIAEVRKAVRARNRAVIRGIGDDCAVLRFRARQDVLVTTDFTLEGIHFRREWHPPESVGHRCLARGLSDIAAMGGEPIAAFLSLALPPGLPQNWVRRFTHGFLDLAGKYGVTLAGGDTAQSPAGILADIVVLGVVPKGKAVLRSSARPGDRIFVSGELGGSAAALAELRKHRKKKLAAGDYPRHFYPQPRLELAQILRQKNLASAMIDTSDGLSTDLAHIGEESGVGAEINAALIPRARVGKPARQVDLDFALHGGEDYELLFTSRPGQKIPAEIAGVRITEIGRIMRGRAITLRDAGIRKRRLQPRGWEHFRP
jgi:thiamine-monophosphate kinase